MLLGVLVGAAAGGQVAEIAAFPADAATAKADHVVYSLQFSADSSRLLVLGGAGKTASSPNPSMTPGAIWDLGRKQLVAFWPNAGLAAGNGAQEVAGNHAVSGWSVSGPSIWDSAAGKAIKPGPLDGLFKVYCTAQAISADGALLAVAWDQAVGKSSGTKMQFRLGSIGVWDVKARKCPRHKIAAAIATKCGAGCINGRVGHFGTR